MKEYEKWTEHIEEKIARATKERSRRLAVMKKCTLAVLCTALLAGSVLAAGYYVKNNTPSGPVPDVTDTQAQTGEGTLPEDTQTPPDDVPGCVTYKTETGEYSWLVGQSGAPIGGTSYICPDGHYGEMGYSSYHDIPFQLVVGVNGLEGDWRNNNKVDLIYKAMYYENLGQCIAGKCNGLTIRDYIDQNGITREEFDTYVDLVEEFAVNLDVLYGDYEYCFEYYRYTKVFERRYEMYMNYREAVHEIFDYANIPEGLAADSVERSRIFRYSIPELAYHYGLSEAELRSAMEEALKFSTYECCFDYDFSVIYNSDGTLRDELAALDVRYNDFESVVSYASELGEAFCRIYDWEDPAEIGDVKNEGEGLSDTYTAVYTCTGECIDPVAYSCRDFLNAKDPAWQIPKEVLKDSPSPLKTLIDEYGLTREELDDVLTEMEDNYDIPYDVLFEGTMDDVLQYYASTEHRVGHYAYTSYVDLYMFIRNYYNDSEGRSLKMLVPASIPELVLAGDISREELEAIIAEVKRREEKTQIYYGGAFYQYEYNLDVIYNEDGSFKDLSGYKSGELEALFTGDDRFIKLYEWLDE